MQQDYSYEQEIKVGITEFLTPGVQIPAITKYLMSDFIVNQIDKENKLIKLDQLPGQLKEQKQQQILFEINQELSQNIQQILGKQALLSINQLYRQLQCGERINLWQLQIKVTSDKQERTKIHNFIRQKLHYIQSITLPQDKIKLKFNKKVKKTNPALRQKYTHFVLYKHSIDTINAIFRLSKAIGISQKLFSSAGLKDKRGHTTQKISVYNTDLATLHKFYKQAYRNRQLWICDFSQGHEQKIQVGGLSGNQFGLILRLLNPHQQKIIVQRVQNLKQKGMINYFGLQRFGQFSIKTYQLGLMVVKKQWKKIIESVILSDCNNFQVNQLKQQLYNKKQFDKAQRLLQNKYKIQKLMFRGLHKQGQNYQNVYQSLPRSIKTLYTHSLQSYIWNKIVSRRIKQHGLQLKIGDIVGIKANTNKQQNKQIEQQQIDQIKDQAQQDDEQFLNQLITNQNIKNYTVFDLVAPLYGSKTILPKQSLIYKYIVDQLNQLHLNQQDFITVSKSQNSKSSWRKILVPIQVVQYQIITHSDCKQDLQSPFYYMNKKVEIKEGQLKSLRIVIKLPKSSYATMAIRQILHISSQFNVQMSMNKKYQALYKTQINIKQ